MSAPTRLPRLLRRRAAEDARVRAFVAAIRRSADCADACAHVPTPRADEPPTVALPLDLVRLMVSPR